MEFNMRTKSDKVIEAIALTAGAYFVGTAIYAAIKRKKEGTAGIGAAKQKRRIWKEVEAAQRAGINLTDKKGYERQGAWEKLTKLAEGKIQPEGISPMEVRYFNSLRRAYNSVAGTDLPYDESVVRNENGDIVLVYRDYHLDKLQEIAIDEMRDNWWSTNLSAKGAMMQTIADIASGKLKFIWKSKGNKHGVNEVCFGGKDHPQERKQRISYLASAEKGGVTPHKYAHILWERTGGEADDHEILNGVIEAIRQTPSVGKAREDVMWEFYKNHSTDNNGLLYQDVPF